MAAISDRVACFQSAQVVGHLPDGHRVRIGSDMVPFGVEIRHLRYFAAVAEELHFGRAARKLYMSRPPLSKRIADLEDELGVQLFVRTSRSVHLTPHGHRLLPLARAVIRAFDAAVDAMALPADIDRALRVALVSTTSPDVVRTLKALSATWHIDLDWSEASTAEQHKGLLDGLIDIGVMGLHIDTQGLWVSSPLRKILGVAVSPEHPLASDQPIALSDLQDQTILLPTRSSSPGHYDDLLATCRENGFHPRKVKHGDQRHQALMVESGLLSDHAVTFIPKSDAVRLGHVSWRPIEGEPLVWEIAVCCRHGEQKDAVMQAAIHAVLGALQEHDNWIDAKR
ncbi:LysR family transcriptional regulator [Rhodococcus koreensis]|uniref:LysR family transcriptional regulator n=1 Tax=Rhodococcus koreensis TaxID=99653 RepID=UPI00366B386D